jgi:hypothetical protein
MLRLFRVRAIIRIAFGKGKHEATQTLIEEWKSYPILFGANKPNESNSTWLNEFKRALDTPELKDQIKSICDNTVAGCLIPLDSAIIVFAHSLLDVVLQECLQVSVQTKRSDWLEYLQERKVKLSEIVAKDLKTIQDEILSQHLAALSRESLLKRSDILHSISRPADSSLSKDVFTRHQLEHIDNIRHSIVHQLEFHKELKNIDEVLNSIQKIGIYFVILVGETHCLPLCNDATTLVPHLNSDLGQLVSAFSKLNELEK